MIDYIVGFAFLPVSILMFTNIFGWTHIENILGIPFMGLAALGLIMVQVSNIMSAHINKQWITTSWILCAVMMWPSIIYLISGFVSFPESLLIALPSIFASFLFVEGIYSFYIDVS
jgi:hypothetical protein